MHSLLRTGQLTCLLPHQPTSTEVKHHPFSANQEAPPHPSRNLHKSQPPLEKYPKELVMLLEQEEKCETHLKHQHSMKNCLESQ